MLQYEGAECPYCHQALHDGDDITVCPICGAPYHRECAKKAGGCVLEDLHKEGRQWQKIARPGASTIDGFSERRCSRCGTLASPGAKYCEICGNPLDNEQPDEPPYTAGMNGTGNNADPSRQAPPYQIPFDPFVNPMGGLDPEEMIDDVPAKDAAVYIRQNTPYFLPKFKEFFRKDKENRKSFSWNWAAFLFDTYYLFYRKMYGLGAIVLVLSTILSVPSLLMSFDNLATLINPDSSFVNAIGISPDKLLILYNLCGFLSMVLKAVIAAGVNRVYAGQSIKKIKKLRSEHTEDEQYHAALAAKGGVSIIGVLIAFAVTIAVSAALSSIFMPYIG